MKYPFILKDCMFKVLQLKLLHIFDIFFLVTLIWCDSDLLWYLQCVMYMKAVFRSWLWNGIQLLISNTIISKVPNYGNSDYKWREYYLFKLPLLHRHLLSHLKEWGLGLTTCHSQGWKWEDSCARLGFPRIVICCAFN